MIILVAGEHGSGKTYFCRELHNAVGKHGMFSLNDGCNTSRIESIVHNRSKIPYPVIVITGEPMVLRDAEIKLRATNTAEPIVFMQVLEPVL